MKRHLCLPHLHAEQSFLAVTMTAAPLALGLLWCSGCTSDPSPVDAGPPGADAAVVLLLANDCTGEMPSLMLNADPPTFPTADLTDSFSAFSSCGITDPLSGRDGFFQFDAAADDRWHVLARPTADDQDVAVYFLSSCDESTCRSAHDSCGDGQPEHAHFVSEGAATYIVGIESSTAAPVVVSIMHPTCGDGMLTHGETCDDGNRDEQDGCDNLCRVELFDATSSEVEPNDDTIEANVIVLAGGTGETTVSGALGGACDSDSYMLRVPEGGSIVATALDASGAPCGATTPPMELVLSEGGEMEVTLGVGTPGGAGGSCPSIEVGASFAMGLAAGEYFITVEADHNAEIRDYQILLQVLPAP